MHEPSLAQQILIGCDKILFSHTQRGYQFFFVFIIISLFFVFFLLFYVIIYFYKNYFIIIIFINFFVHENYFYFCMFRDVPACSGMFRVPGFIDGPFQWPKCETTSRIRRASEMVVRSNDFDHLATVFRGTYC